MSQNISRSTFSKKVVASKEYLLTDFLTNKDLIIQQFNELIDQFNTISSYFLIFKMKYLGKTTSFYYSMYRSQWADLFKVYNESKEYHLNNLREKKMQIKEYIDKIFLTFNISQPKTIYIDIKTKNNTNKTIIFTLSNTKMSRIGLYQIINKSIYNSNEETSLLFTHNQQSFEIKIENRWQMQFKINQKHGCNEYHEATKNCNEYLHTVFKRAHFKIDFNSSWALDGLLKGITIRGVTQSLS
jgi:hypothetical protein